MRLRAANHTQHVSPVPSMFISVFITVTPTSIVIIEFVYDCFTPKTIKTHFNRELSRGKRCCGSIKHKILFVDSTPLGGESRCEWQCRRQQQNSIRITSYICHLEQNILSSCRFVAKSVSDTLTYLATVWRAFFSFLSLGVTVALHHTVPCCFVIINYDDDADGVGRWPMVCVCDSWMSND